MILMPAIPALPGMGTNTKGLRNHSDRDVVAAAVEELVVRYQGRLIRVLENIVRSRDRDEELAQDVFLRVYRARKTYAPNA